MYDENKIISLIKKVMGDPTHQCYAASEAAYHLLDRNYTPVRGGGHWWLRRKDGTILDITAEQYPNGFDYRMGKGGGFLTREPSRRASVIIAKVLQELENENANR